MKKIKEIWQKIRARLSGANLAHGPIAEMAEEGDGGKRMPVWLRKTIWAVFLTGFLTCFFVFLAFAWYAFIYLDDEFDLSSVDSSLNYTSVVYGLKDGAYVEAETLHTSENRIWANIEEIPDDLQKAFIAIEDERFYQHSGVDLLRTAKAVLNFLNISSDSVYGGSTITQQVIKNITGESEQTIPRKIQEIRRAWYVEREYKKDQILEVYLNTIYLSQGCYGVQTAAEVYFNKTLDELTLLECAAPGTLLLGMVDYQEELPNITLADVELTVKLPEGFTPKRVRRTSDGKTVPFRFTGGELALTFDRFRDAELFELTMEE